MSLPLRYFCLQWSVCWHQTFAIFVFRSLCNHSHYIQRKDPYKSMCDFKANCNSCRRAVFCQSFIVNENHTEEYCCLIPTMLSMFIVVWSQPLLRSLKELDNLVLRSLSVSLRKLTFGTRFKYWVLLCEELEWMQPDQIDYEKRNNVTGEVYPAWMLIKKKDKSPKMIALLLDSFVIQILVRLSYYFRLFSSVIVNDLKQRKK